MTNRHDISAALLAADEPIMVESARQLRDSVAEWLEGDVVGIDTEFVRERTWRADLGLVQVSNGRKVWLVDPLKTGPLQPLRGLFEHPGVVKVLHAPSEDLEVLLHTTGAVPQPLFDTQVACALLGQDLQMGYHRSVEWLLDVAIDKGETRSNWCKRPLRPAQLHYAALDVCLLPRMHGILSARLEDLGRSGWLAEDCQRLLLRAQTPSDPADAWKRVSGHGRLDGASLAVLQSLARWRDEEAERRNLARGFVIRDEALLAIAMHRVHDQGSLSALDALHPKVIQRYGRTLVARVEQVLQQGLEARLPDAPGPEHRQLLGLMRQRVQEKAKALSVDPALLASRRELESLVLSAPGEPPPERFLGWRKRVITLELLALKKQLA